MNRHHNDGRRAPAPRMDLREVATSLGCSYRTAARYVSTWVALRGVGVPRVEVRRTGKRGRPAYHVEAESFRAWVVAV